MKTCHSLLSAVFVFLFCLAGTANLHAYVQTYGDFIYTTDNRAATATITHYNGIGGAVEIPSYIRWYTVTRIGSSAFSDCTGLTSLTIPDSVTQIEHHAFYRCTGLTSLTIPNSVTSIGAAAFTDCTSLTSLTIPKSVTTIGAYAFSGCTGLTSLTIPNSVTSIGTNAFSDCSSLVSLTIGSVIMSLDYGVFASCDKITDLTLTDYVDYYSEEGIFVGVMIDSIANNLTSLTIAEGVSRIGNYAFFGCSHLTSVTIPSSVTSIGAGAFAYCTSLTSVTIPNGVGWIEDETFYNCSGLTSVTIPNGVVSIGGRAFSGCSGLTSVIIPRSVSSIGFEAFKGCSGLTSMTLSSSISREFTIDDRAFSGCIGLTSLVVSSSGTNINSSAFEGTSLTSLAFSPLSSRVGSEVEFNFTKLGASGTMKLTGTLPTGLNFNAKTGVLSGKITGKAGSYPLTLQFFNGKTVTRSITLPLVIGAYPSGLAGTFQGLLEANSSGLPAGILSVIVTAPGVWTATLDPAGSSKVLSAKGSFSLDPTHDAVDVTIPFSTALMVHLYLDPNSALVSGDYPQGSIRGFRMASGSELPTSNQLFTLAIDQGPQDGMTIPAGMGWATGTVSNKGAIALTGQLGDGKAFKVTTQLSATGQAIIWLKPYSNLNSFVGGIVSLRDRGLVNYGPDEPLTAGLSWYRVADPKELSYPNGFGPLQVDAGIAPYTVPANAGALATSLGLPAASPITFPSLIIDGGGLPQSIVATLPTSLTLDSTFKQNKVGQTSIPLTGTVNKANGSFSGTLTLPASNSDVLVGAATVSGVLLEGSYYSPHVGSGLVKIPLKSPKGSFRTAALVLSSEAP